MVQVQGSEGPIKNPRRTGVSASQRRGAGLNPAIIKLRKFDLFQTVNNAKVLWDPQAKPSGLLGGHLNICSFISKSDEIKHILVDSNLDFLCLSETWLNKNSPSAALHIPVYNAFRKDRKVSKGGGLGYYYTSKTIYHVKRFNAQLTMSLSIFALTLAFHHKCPSLSSGCIRPPSAKAIFFDKLETVLKECSSGQEILVMGDFNVNWEDKGTSKALQRVSNKFDFTQLIKGPTRMTSSSQTQIDLIFTSKPERVTKSFNMVTGLSDHNLTLIARKLTKSCFHLKPYTKSSQLRIPKCDVD